MGLSARWLNQAGRFLPILVAALFISGLLSGAFQTYSDCVVFRDEGIITQARIIARGQEYTDELVLLPSSFITYAYEANGITYEARYWSQDRYDKFEPNQVIQIVYHRVDPKRSSVMEMVHTTACLPNLFRNWFTGMVGLSGLCLLVIGIERLRRWWSSGADDKTGGKGMRNE